MAFFSRKQLLAVFQLLPYFLFGESYSDVPKVTRPPTHDPTFYFPLDPLSADEILRASYFVKKMLTPPTDYTFVSVTLAEPPKQTLAPYFLNGTNPSPGAISRIGCVTILNRKTGIGSEFFVDIKKGAVIRRVDLPPGVNVPGTVADILIGIDPVKNNAEFRKRCKDLGYEDVESLFYSAWTIGYTGDNPNYNGKRLAQYLIYAINFVGDNPYAHPFPFIVICDVINLQVVDILDCASGSDFSTTTVYTNQTVPTASYNYDPAILGDNFFRKDVKPIQITSPLGPSFTIKGYQINWQKYKFRIGFTPREGVVIHHVTYTDGGKIRPLIYRSSLSELWIPYGDPRPMCGAPRKRVFDQGEFGVGASITTLKANEDCLGSVYFFNTVIVNADGSSEEIPQSICVYEEDAGILWKRKDEVTQKVFTVRSRRLVVNAITSLGNYEYMFYWMFYQDGNIQFEVKLTGILSTNLLTLGSQAPPYGTVVAPQVMAQHHQHVFCVRLDMDIDGVQNKVTVVDVVSPDDPAGSPKNKYGNAIVPQYKDLETAAEGRSDISAEKSRVWKISNQNVKHPASKKPMGYILKPANTATTLWKSDAPAGRQGAFGQHGLWVTQFRDDEFYAAGKYVNTITTDNGLPTIVDSNPLANIKNVDIVTWHTFTHTHYTRPEDWPVMPSTGVGFWLKPMDFFLQNPALDVPHVKGKNHSYEQY